MTEWDLAAITDKWQRRWWEAKVHHAERPAGAQPWDGKGRKPTFFIHFAYPGISGYLHVGHMRGFTYTDVFARYNTNDYWKRFGFLIDERRNCTTIDPGYSKFIQWQFRQLQAKGYLVQKPHYAPFCPVAGPVAVDKSETDIKQGGSAEVLEFV